MKDVVAELRVGVKDLAAEDRAGWSPLGLSDRVRDLVGLTEVMQVELVRGIAQWDRITAWAEDGAVSPTPWLENNTTLTKAEASGLLRVARLYAQHASVAAGMDGGELTVAKARLLWRAEKNREAEFAGVVDGFVELAKDLSAADFGQVLGKWVELVDDHAPPDDLKRRFSWADLSGGAAHTEMFGSADDAAIIRAAIEALDAPDPADCPEGPRSRQERHYDIAIDIFRRALADKLGDEPMTPGGADIILDAHTAAELTADPSTLDVGDDPMADLLAPYRPHAAGEHALGQARRCQYPDGTPARRALAAALLCTGWIHRLIRDPKTGQPLDYSRAQRRFTPRQRRALMVRDGGCVFPGCDRKPKWCDVHHLKPWEDDGPTDLANGCLLCRRHHNLIHHNGWTLQRDPDTGIFTATSPDGRQFSRGPHDRCRP
jgi:hypothetical protein